MIRRRSTAGIRAERQRSLGITAPTTANTSEPPSTRTRLRRAQILAWGELRALADFGDARRSETEQVMAAAQDQMAADPDGDQPGRFGFYTAELHLHLAEGSLLLGDHAQAGRPTLHSAGLRGSWAVSPAPTD